MQYKNVKKCQLLEIIAEKERDIKDLHEQIDKLEKYTKYDESANELKAMHDSFVRSGFTEEQAFTLINTMVGSSLGKPTLFG